MWISVIVAVLAFCISIFCFIVCIYSKICANQYIGEQKKNVQKMFPDCDILVNRPHNLFFMDNAKRVFGINLSGITYSYEGLYSISKYDDSLFITHKDALEGINIGKEPGNDATVGLSRENVEIIYRAMLPILKQNLKKVLDDNRINPTEEYDIDGHIWGCDMNSKQLYFVAGVPEVYKFSDLRRFTIEDLRKNTLYNGAYIVHVILKQPDDFEDYDYEIYVKNADRNYYNLIAMLRKIYEERV